MDGASCAREENENEEEVVWNEDLWLDPHAPFLQQGREEGRAAGLQAGYREGYELGYTTAVDYGMELGFIRGVTRTIASTFRTAHDVPPSFSSSCTSGSVESSFPKEEDPQEDNKKPLLLLCREEQDKPLKKPDRFRKTVSELLRLLDDFPGPEQFFHPIPQPPTQDPNVQDGDDIYDNNADDRAKICDGTRLGLNLQTENEGEMHGDKNEQAPSDALVDVDVNAKMERIRSKFKLLTVQLGLPHFSLQQVMDEQQQQEKAEDGKSFSQGAATGNPTLTLAAASSEW